MSTADRKPQFMQRIAGRTLTGSDSLLSALRRMDSAKTKMLYVFGSEGDPASFLGLVTVGDIQRAIIRNVSLTRPVSDILDRDKIYAHPSDDPEQVSRRMLAMRAESMPVVDSDGRLVGIHFWEDSFPTQECRPQRPPVDLPVIIMAGGKGERLRPLTNVLPKPLIPVGDKTILEEIIDRFRAIGCRRFILSVNYKADIIRYYLDSLGPDRPDVTLIEESQPMGTIGALSLMDRRPDTPMFVSNCDILINQDMRDPLAYHLDNRNDITLVTAVNSLTIPYGVVESGPDGLMTSLTEKPELTYQINTGVYILSPEVIDLIPRDRFFHITHLIDRLRARGGRIGCFPVSAAQWQDMGQWDQYLKMIHI